MSRGEKGGAMNENGALFEYKRVGFRMTVYSTYIDLWGRRGLLAQEETIMLSEVTAVGVSRKRQLQLTTRDGAMRELLVGWKAKKAKAAILRAMRGV